jgi:hypothetical protein
MTEPRLRDAARGLVLDESDRVLLVRLESLVGSARRLPGAGAEPIDVGVQPVRSTYLPSTTPHPSS